MDNYPEALAPQGLNTEKELFIPWWRRVGPSFPTVPRNVARQWLHRSWGSSPYRWLPSAGAQFTLEIWQPADIALVQIVGEDDPCGWGEALLELGSFAVSSIMNRRHRWPAPPIVWHRIAPIPNEGPRNLPTGFLLVEGFRRVAIAKALERRGTLAADLPVWVLRYPDADGR